MKHGAATLRTLGVALSFVMAATWVAGCDESGGGNDSGDDDDGVPGQDGGPDASPGSGMTVRFAYLGPDGPAENESPIEFGTFTLEEMTMQLHKVKLTGDNSPGGGLELRSRVLDFPWAAAPRVIFDAGPGLYSRLDFRVERTYHDEDEPDGFDGERLSIKVLGKAHLPGGDRDFEYIEEEKVDIRLGFPGVEVTSAQPGTITVALDIATWFATVDWVALDADQQGDDDDDDDGNEGPGGGDDDGEGDDDGGEDAGPGDGGPAGDGGPPGPGGPAPGGDTDAIRIGKDGDRETADRMRDALEQCFQVFPP
jgi:hypothetical protein